MTKIDINLIRKLREQTSAGIIDCRTALEECDCDLTKAKDWLKKRGLERAAKKSGREIKAGLVYAYIHGSSTEKQGGRIGAMIKIGCETDFVAKTQEFQNLCKEIAMQVASMDPESVEELLEQPYIRDTKKTVNQLIKEVIGKLGENIEVREIIRFAI